jgi:hypothetical protein
MKKRFAVLTGIAALALVFGLAALTACSSPTGSGGGDPAPGPGSPTAPQSSVFMGTDGDGNAYVLEITENTAGRAAYKGKKGDSFKLTIIYPDGSEKLCTGTIETIVGTEFTLKPKNGTTFNVKRSSDGTIEQITGVITLDAGGAPLAEPTLIPPEINGVRVYVEKESGGLAEYDGNAWVYYGGGSPFTDLFVGLISGGKLYLSPPSSIPEGRLQADLQHYLNNPTTGGGTITNIIGSTTVTPNTIKFGMVSQIELLNKDGNYAFLRLEDTLVTGSSPDMAKNSIDWIYVNGNEGVNGTTTYTSTETFDSLTEVFNMTITWSSVNLQSGWNKLKNAWTGTQDSVVDNGDGTRTATWNNTHTYSNTDPAIDTAIADGDYKWVLYQYQH